MFKTDNYCVSLSTPEKQNRAVIKRILYCITVKHKTVLPSRNYLDFTAVIIIPKTRGDSKCIVYTRPILLILESFLAFPFPGTVACDSVYKVKL